MGKEISPKDREQRIVLYGCAKWHCDNVNNDWETFGIGFPTRRTYCLNHIPKIVKLKMWLKGIR